MSTDSVGNEFYDTDGGLPETLPESLKNMLLVMSASGLFRPPASQAAADSSTADGASEHSPSPARPQPELVWEQTWHEVDQFLPDFRNEYARRPPVANLLTVHYPPDFSRV